MLFSNYSTNSNKTITVVLFKIFICFTIYFNSFTSAHAAGLNGWTLQNPIAKGASVAYEGVKNVIINGKNVAKTSTALITPTATQVAKVLARGGAAYALTFAVEQLLGKVDWVLDPENNRIKYFPADYTFTCSTGAYTSTGQTFKLAAENTCRKFSDGVKYVDVVLTGDTTYNCLYENGGVVRSYASTCSRVAVVDRDKPQYLPLPDVARQVISNAESGDKNAQAATTAAAADIVNDAQKDDAKARPIVNQLEANSKTETDADSNTATGETKPNTTTGGTDLSLSFPIFCGWAPQVCEAAQVVISFPQTLTNWWDKSVESLENAYSYAKTQVQAIRDYFKEEKPEKEQTEVEIPDVPPVTDKVNISIGDNICPSMPVSIHIPFGTVETDISPTYLCEIAQGMKAFFIALGMYTASLIVGRRT